jgi:uncharacterized membrane protein YkoI
MKLKADAIVALEVLVQTAVVTGVEKLVISGGKIQGIDERKTVGLVTDKGVPDLEGKTIAINRVKTLLSRISLAKAQGDMSIEATVAQNGTDISILELQGGKSKGQFRCASLEAVKGVPKGFQDPLAWEVNITTKLIPLIAQAEASMTTDGITLASKNGKTVTLDLVDSNKDVVDFELDGDAKWIGSGPQGSSFCNKYPSKALLSLLREASKTQPDAVKLSIGQGGLLIVTVNGLDFFALPQA